MNVLCNWLGHKFIHCKWGERVPCKTCFGSSDNVIKTYDGLYVKKWCERCGYEHSDTFEIAGTGVRLK